MSYSNTKPHPPWELQEVLAAFFIGFLLVPIFVNGVIVSFFPTGTDLTRLLAVQFSSYLSWIMMLARLYQIYGKAGLEALGVLCKKPLVSYVSKGIYCGAGILMIGVVLGHLAQHFGWPYVQPYQHLPADQLQWIAILAVVVAPVFEELTFRGILQPSLQQRFSAFPAMLLTALIFTLFHRDYYGQWLALSYVMLMGTVLSMFRYYTQSLFPCMIGHLINNVLAALVIFQ